MHIAPAFGEDDAQCRPIEHGLPFVQLVDDEGADVAGGTPWDGTFVKKMQMRRSSKRLRAGRPALQDAR